MSRKILIVGGVAGGASFAARMRRLDEDAQIHMFERGPYISFANCGLPYHIGGGIPKRKSLILQTPDQFLSRYNIKVLTNTEVSSVDLKSKTVSYASRENICRETYDFLLLSPGCKPVKPPLPGIDHPNIFTLRNIPDMDRIIKSLKTSRQKSASIIGGGFIGLEMAESLRNLEWEVSLIELCGQVFPPADPEMANLLHEHLREKGVRLILGDGVTKFDRDKGGQINIILNSGACVASHRVILAIGVCPDTAFLKDSGIRLNPNGAIIVDQHMRTSSPEVYAVGDAVEITDFVSGQKTQLPLAGPANRQGRIAADNIAGIPSTYKCSQGTAICKVFDLTAAVTGTNEKSAKACGLPYLKTYLHWGNRAGYYPGASQMSLKILFCPEDGKLLGAQIMGKEGADKRIDVLATAIRHGLTVYDLAELELAYAPPYGSAKDAVNIAGFIGQNMLEGRMQVFYAEDLKDFDPQTHMLLDVRTKKERRKGAIPGSTHIPIDNLRQCLSQIERDKEILVYCQIGFRGYLACRILTHHGYKAKNLSGGYQTYAVTKHGE